VRKRHLVIALPAVRARTIGTHVLTRARLLAVFYRVTVISDSFPDSNPRGVRFIQVVSHSFSYLRRFCHVPNELAFAYVVRKELRKLQSRDPIDFILCHGYTLTRFVGRYLWDRQSVHYGMFMHGHIFTRPRGTYDSRLTAFYRWLAPACYREAHLIFALSPDQVECAIRAGAPANRVVLTPNGIQREDVGAANREVESAKIATCDPLTLKLLYVGRLSVEKGVITLLRACRFLADWKVEYSLTVIGDGPEVNKLSDLVTRSGILDNVKFVNSVPRERLGGYYRAADILCVPSLDEPLGNVVLEGLICGCPVVGSDVGGIRFIISDGETGYLVSAAKPKRWAEKLKFIAENKDTLKSIAENGRKMVERRFDWKNIMRHMHESIARILA
jgi:glycosyltransferase involved in cell wall biosynthesis